MEQQGSSPELTAIELVLKIWPLILGLAALILAAIELRVRKIIDDKITKYDEGVEHKKLEDDKLRREQLEKIGKDIDKLNDRIEQQIRDFDFKFRTELQGPIGDIGNDAMAARKLAESYEPRMRELETKTGIFWRMIERSTADLLRQQPEDEG